MEFGTARENDIKSGVVEILKNELNPDKIILFGSRAKNKADRFSDFDFAVDATKPPIGKLREIKEHIGEISGLYRIDIVFLSEVEKEFLDIIKITGLVIYEK